MRLIKKILPIIIFSISTLLPAQTTRLALSSKDGTKLNALLSVPDEKEEIKAAILVIHGLQSHSEWHRKVIESWQKKGIVALVFDRRGSGSSEGERGHFHRPGDLQDDTLAAFDYLKSVVSAKTPLYIFANSFGYMVSVPFVMNHAEELSGLILSSPAPASTKESDYSLKDKAKIFVSRPHVHHEVAFGTDYITTSSEGRTFMQNDPLMVNQFTSSFLRNTLFMRSYANMKFKKLPIPALVILAKNDRIVDIKKASKILSSTATGKTEEVIINGDHDLTLSGHGAEVNEAMMKWLKL